MDFTKIKTMTPPTPTDWTGLGIIWGICASVITVCFKWIDSYFASKKTESETFINRVVETAMIRCLEDVNSKINTLFQYREADRTHIDTKFDGMMKEIRK